MLRSELYCLGPFKGMKIQSKLGINQGALSVILPIMALRGAQMYDRSVNYIPVESTLRLMEDQYLYSFLTN